MKSYRIVKRETNPTILLDEVNFSEGFIIVTSDDEAVGIIVRDLGREDYLFITHFFDYFRYDHEPCASDPSLEELMKKIKDDYTEPIEFNFIKVTYENRP